MLNCQAVAHHPQMGRPDPPFEITAPSMLHRWEALTFLHRPVEPSVIQALLPTGLEVDTFDGAAWVGMIPFWLRVRRPGLPYAPWAASFPETNVRTYVRGPSGAPGIWFFSLDAARLGAVLAARRFVGLPYEWASMGLLHAGDTIRYSSVRRGPDARGARGDAWIRIGDRCRPGGDDELDVFLTARWRLYRERAGALEVIHAVHEPWPLHRARPVRVDDGLVRAAGIETGDEPWLARFASRVDVRLGRWHPCDTRGNSSRTAISRKYLTPA